MAEIWMDYLNGPDVEALKMTDQEILDAVEEAEKNPPPPKPRYPQPPDGMVEPPEELGPFLPRPGESFDDFRKRFEAECGPLEEGEVLNPDGSVTKTTTTTIVLSLSDLFEERDEYPLPEPSSRRWIVFVVVNGIGIALILILLFLRKNTLSAKSKVDCPLDRREK